MLHEQIEKLDSTQADQDKEIESLGTELTNCLKNLHSKMDNTEGTKIWKHFDRFALYDDLKDLRHECIPQLAKFEQRIIEFTLAQDQSQHIIRRFDETIAQKSSKQAVHDVYTFLEKKYASKADFTKLQRSIDAQMRE